MKKFLQNTLIRSLSVLTLGILLVVFSGDMSQWMAMASGLVFVIMGSVALVSYLRRDKESRQLVLYPILAIACVLFGLVQIIFPDLFFSALRYLLAGMAFLLAIVQFYSLWEINKAGIKVSWFYYLFPTAGVGLSLFVILYQKFVEKDPLIMIVLGVGFIIYALLELWTMVLVKRPAKAKDASLPELK